MRNHYQNEAGRTGAIVCRERFRPRNNHTPDGCLTGVYVRWDDDGSTTLVTGVSVFHCGVCGCVEVCGPQSWTPSYKRQEKLRVEHRATCGWVGENIYGKMKA